MSIIDDEEELKDYGLIDIDGVNVAECRLFQIFYDSTKEVELKWCNAHNCACADFDNCQHKQLQRLKAENERLHITIEKLKGDLYIAKDSLRDYQEHYNKLEAENEKRKMES